MAAPYSGTIISQLFSMQMYIFLPLICYFPPSLPPTTEWPTPLFDLPGYFGFPLQKKRHPPYNGTNPPPHYFPDIFHARKTMPLPSKDSWLYLTYLNCPGIFGTPPTKENDSPPYNGTNPPVIFYAKINMPLPL